MSAKSPQALVIVFDGIEEIEALTPVDLLRRADVQVTIATLDGQSSVTGRNQIRFCADASLSSVDVDSFDLVILPGGPGVLELLENAQLKALLIQQNESAKKIAAICAAPKVLANNGILDDRSATSHISVRKDLPNPCKDPVVVDQNIITSQGLGTAVDFSLSLVKSLRGKEIAQEIAASIHYSHTA